jgi:hypothetical protein
MTSHLCPTSILPLVNILEDVTAVLRPRGYWCQMGKAQPQTGHGLRSDQRKEGSGGVTTDLGQAGGQNDSSIRRCKSEPRGEKACDSIWARVEPSPHTGPPMDSRASTYPGQALGTSAMPHTLAESVTNP